MLNRLLNINSGFVDITNIANVNDSLALGVGAGPEAEPVSSVTALAGEAVLFDLYVNNTSDLAMDFNLSASIHSDFSSVELPEYWHVQFLREDNTTVSNTGVINAGDFDFVRVQVKVAIPVAALPSRQSIYFKAENERYSVSDIKHDQVVVGSQESIYLLANQEGHAQVGGVRVYEHTLENRGTTDIADITLSVSNSDSDNGWVSVLFEDTDDSGQLSAADQPIASTPLLSGELKKLFVKVSVPANANTGDVNNTELTAFWDDNSLSVTNITSVSASEITVLKEQALDDGCDGILDSPYSRRIFAVAPGNNCVSYRLTATNLGNTSVHNVVVADATPVFTSYFDSAKCSKTIFTADNNTG